MIVKKKPIINIPRIKGSLLIKEPTTIKAKAILLKS